MSLFVLVGGWPGSGIARRHPGHRDRGEDELWGRPVEPLGVGPLVEVDTSGPVDVPALAGRIRTL